MSITATSDLAKLTLSKTMFTRADQKIAKLNAELISGRLQNLGRDRFEHATEINQLKQKFTQLDAFKIVHNDAKRYFDAIETNLDGIQAKSSNMAEQFLTSVHGTSSAVFSTAAQLAENTFRDVVTHLNAQTDGQALFSGSKAMGLAISDVEAFLTDLRTSVATATDSSELQTVLEDWFSTTTGQFNAYLSSTFGEKVRFQLSTASDIQNEVSADASAFRNVLKSAALVFLSVERGFSTPEIKDALQTSAENLLSVQEDLAQARALNGLNSALLDSEISSQSAERATLSLRYNALTAADPYDTAAQLQATQTQLERLFVLTSRMEKLSFLEFMK